MERSGGTRLSVALALSLGVLLAALAVPAGAAAGDSGRANGAGEQSIRIWAYFDGDTPVTAGRVRVYADGERLRGDGIAGGNRWTFSDGTALLLVDSLPSKLRVVISGGRAGGRPVRGSLKTNVDGADVGDVIEVNPVTTVAEVWDRREGGSDRHARNLIERTLGIPRLLNDADLYATDRWFDGDRFQRWTLERGSVEEAARALVRLADEPGFDRRLFRPHDGEGRQAPAAAAPIGGTANAVLNAIIEHLADPTSVTSPRVVIGIALKGLVAAFSSGGEFDSKEETDLSQIQAQLNEISTRLAGLEVQMANLGFDLKVKDTEPSLSKIDAAERDLEYALSGQEPCDPKDPRACASRPGPPALGTNARIDILAARSAEFLKTAEELAKPSFAQTFHDLLATQRPGGLEPLITGFRAKVGRSSRFFTHESSQEIDRFFDYYKGYEVRLAELQAEYHTFRGDPKLTTAQNFVNAKDAAQKMKNVFLPAQQRLMPEADMDPRIFIDTNNQTDPAKMNLWATRTSNRAGPQIWQEDGLVPKSNAQCSEAFYFGFSQCRTVLYIQPHFVDGLGPDIFPPGFVRTGAVPWYIPTKEQVLDLLGPDPLARLNALGVLSNGERIKAGNTLWLRDQFWLERQDLLYDNISIEATQLKLLGTKPGPTSELRDFLVADRCSRDRFPRCPNNHITWSTSGLILWSFGPVHAIKDLYW